MRVYQVLPKLKFPSQQDKNKSTIEVTRICFHNYTNNLSLYGVTFAHKSDIIETIYKILNVRIRNSDKHVGHYKQRVCSWLQIRMESIEYTHCPTVQILRTPSNRTFSQLNIRQIHTHRRYITNVVLQCLKILNKSVRFTSRIIYILNGQKKFDRLLIKFLTVLISLIVHGLWLV